MREGRPDTVDARRQTDAASDRLRPRRFRLVPPAVTPVRGSDVAAGVAGQVRGIGRDRFRQAVEELLDAASSATYTSFRRALAAALRELHATADGDRRRVLLPAFCSSDFAAAVAGVGLEPVRYDVDPATLARDRASLADALDGGALAVVAVNVLGYGSPMDDLAATCEAADAVLVEALGYALGTTYRGAPLGTFGDCAVLNFQQGKPVPVGGGMVVSRNPDLHFADAGRESVGPNVATLAGYAALSRPRPYYAYRRLQGVLSAAGWDGRPTTHPESKHDVGYAPPFATMSNFQGAVGRRVFERLDDHRRRRREAADRYAAALSDCSGVDTLDAVPGLADHQHVRYPVLAASEALRDQLRGALADAGVQATTLYDWPPIDAERFPGAATLQRRILTLPTHPYVGERDLETVVATIRAETTAERWDGGGR